MRVADTCDIPNCPALPKQGTTLCPLHAFARTAKDLAIAQSASGAGGQKCLRCKRVFKAGDYVERVPVLRPRGAVRKTMVPGNPHGYTHVACDPPSARVNKKLVREAAKPLLAYLE